MAKIIYKSSHRSLGKEAWRRASPVLQKKIPEEGISMLGNTRG
jgi:hypothetical protein